MHHELLGVDVIQTLDQLLEQVLCIVFLELPSLPDVAEQIPTLAELHDKAYVLICLECIVKPHNILMAALLQDAHLLHDPSLLFFLVAQNLLLDRLDGHKVLTHLVARQIDLSKSASTQDSSYPIKLTAARHHGLELREMQLYLLPQFLNVPIEFSELHLLGAL